MVAALSQTPKVPPDPRRPRTKDVPSRYLSSSNSSSNSNSTSSSSSTTTTTTSSSSSSSSRRFLSPFSTPRPLPHANAKRSQSVDRPRPTPSSEISTSSSVVRALCTTTTTTRSLSVSFQGESFFYHTTSRAKSSSSAAPPSPHPRRPTPDRRRSSSTTPSRSADLPDASRPADLRRWPAASRSTPLMRSLDCSLDRKDSVARLLHHSGIFDEGRRASFDAGELSASSDSDSVSSGSNSGAQEPGRAPRRSSAAAAATGARLWQEANGRPRQAREAAAPLSPQFAVMQKLALSRSVVVESPRPSARAFASPMRGPVRAASPCKAGTSPGRAMASPARIRNGSSVTEASSIGQPGLAPSILSFAAEIRRAKKGENRIEEAHLLRLLHNRYLQWRYVNARAAAALMLQKSTAEKNLYNAWVATSEMHNSIAIKRIKLQLLRQNLKLTAILKGQMGYLEEWSQMDKDHSTALFGAVEALKASTIRLPVVSGARVDIQDVKEAVCSAVDVMQAMASSIRSLLTKAEGTSTLLLELAIVVAQERDFLNQAKDLLSTFSALHVKHSSLQGHLLQLNCHRRVKPL